MGKISKVRVKGSYTIEAALIVPLVFFIIIGLIYLSFYLHDLGKVQAIIYESQSRGKALVRNEVNMNTGIQSYSDYIARTIFYPLDNSFPKKEEEIRDYINERSRGELFIASIDNVDIDVGVFSIKLKVDLSFDFPFKFLEKFFSKSRYLEIESKGKIHNPTNFIRGYQVSKDVGKELKVVEDVTNKLKEIIESFKK